MEPNAFFFCPRDSSSPQLWYGVVDNGGASINLPS